MIRTRTRSMFDRQQQREMLRRAAERAEDFRFRERLRFDRSPFWDLQPAWLAPMMLSCTLLEEYARLYGSDEGWERI